jgi:hypothetical protein
MKNWTKISMFLSLAGGFAIWHYGLLAGLTPSDLRTFVGLLAQISATMLGFLLAALAILASIAGQRLLRNMQKTGHYRVLLQRFFVDSLAYGVATGASLIAYLANASLLNASIAAITLVLFASLLLMDVGWRFWLVLSNLTPDPISKT